MSALSAQARTEVALTLRNGEQILVSLVIPLLVLVFFSTVDLVPLPEGATSRVDVVTPGVLALAVMSTAMVGLGIGTGFERQYKVLKRLGATPLGRGRWLGAKMAAVLVTLGIQFAVLVPVALYLGWSPAGTGWLAVPALLAGTAAFGGIGLLMAGTLRGTVTLAMANAVYVVLLLVGGLVVPLDELPGAVAVVAKFLPAAALTGVLSDALGGGAAPGGTQAWAVLAAWAVAAPLAAARLFRWE
jgi:ABC-2 type transport system permease protein